MTTTNLNPNSSNFSQIKAMFEGPKTRNKPQKIFENNDLSSVTNTNTKPKVKPPVPERLTKKLGMSKSPVSSIKPGNSEEKAKIHENDRAAKLKEIQQKISARKIQRYFREHLEKLSKIETNSCGYKMTTYDGNYESQNVKGKGNRKHQGTNFYFETGDGDKGTKHVLYSPAEKPVKPLAGACKYVAGMDERFVALKLNFLQKLTMSLNKKYNDYNDLTGTSTVIPGIAVDSETIISRFGGDNLGDYLQKKNFINPAHFENSVKDLKTLHKKNTYLTDIKTENLTYDGKNVNFIDVDNRVKIDPAKSNIIKPHMTPCFTTTKLLRILKPDAFGGLSHSFSFTPDEAAAKKPYLKVCDEYAFLLSMIEATTRKSASKIAFNAVPVENIDQINGIMNDKNERYFLNWIQKHVKSKFHLNVESILRDPHEYAEKSSNPPYLSDMLLFSSSV